MKILSAIFFVFVMAFMFGCGTSSRTYQGEYSTPSSNRATASQESESQAQTRKDEETKGYNDYRNILYSNYSRDGVLTIKEWEIVFDPSNAGSISLPDGKIIHFAYHAKTNEVLEFMARPPNNRIEKESVWIYEKAVVDRLTQQRKILYIRFGGVKIFGEEIGPIDHVVSIFD